MIKVLLEAVYLTVGPLPVAVANPRRVRILVLLLCYAQYHIVQSTRQSILCIVVGLCGFAYTYLCRLVICVLIGCDSAQNEKCSLCI